MPNQKTPVGDVVGLAGPLNQYPLEPNNDGSINVNLTTPGGATRFNNTVGARVTHGQAKASAGTLKSISASNLNAAIRYLQFFDTVAALSTGVTVPIDVYELPAGAPTGSANVLLDVNFLGGGGGQAFATGITWGISSTKDVWTDVTASDHLVTGFYV